MNNMKQKTVNGVVWAIAEQFSLYGVKFILGIILARLLTPADFGLIAMITVFFAVADVFVNSGFGMAYVQKKVISKTDADTVFYTNLFISIVLFISFFSSAGLIARFYEQPILTNIIQTMSIVLIINAFDIVQRAQVIRAVNFKRLTKITIGATFLSGIIGISAAFLGFSVWALVIQSLCNRLFAAAALWFTSTYRPGRHFSWKSFKEMFNFGSWILITSIVGKVFENLYLLIIGKFFPAAQLGFYSKAKQFQQMASNNIGNAIGSVAFPVYSKLQDDKIKLKKSMHDFLVNSMFFIVPLLMGLFILAESFVLLLLTEKWAPMIPYLQLLCIGGALFPIHIVNVQALTAQGKTRLSFNLDVIKNVLRILNIILTYRFGVFYIVVGEVILSFISLIINTWYSKIFINYGLFSQLIDIWKITLVGFFATGIVFLSNRIITSVITEFIIGFFLFSAVYLGTHFIFNKAQFNNTKKLILSLKASK